jgi:hypothetical protein
MYRHLETRLIVTEFDNSIMKLGNRDRARHA